jgi:aspartate aminotransferase
MTAIADEAARRDIWVSWILCYDKAHLRPDAAQPAAAFFTTDCAIARSFAIGLEGVRDDRVALRLGDRPGVVDRSGATPFRVIRPSNVCSITQKAVTAALNGPQAMRDRDARRVSPPAAIRPASGCRPSRVIRLVKPAGAFYLFPDVSEFLSPDGIRTTMELAQALLDEARVAVTPGEAFDAPGFLRISYATSLQELKRGTERLLTFVRSLESRKAVAG